MPVSLRPPVVAGPLPKRSQPAAIPCAPDHLGPAAVTLSGVAVAGGLVWHFINPGGWMLDPRLALAATVATAAVVAAGVFRWLRPAGGAGDRWDDAVDGAAAARLREQLEQGRAVSWAGPVYLLPAGVQANGKVYPWHQLRPADGGRRGRSFFLFVHGKDEPVATVPTTSANFAAGRRVVEELVAEAQREQAPRAARPTPGTRRAAA